MTNSFFVGLSMVGGGYLEVETGSIAFSIENHPPQPEWEWDCWAWSRGPALGVGQPRKLTSATTSLKWEFGSSDQQGTSLW